MTIVAESIARDLEMLGPDYALAHCAGLCGEIDRPRGQAPTTLTSRGGYVDRPSLACVRVRARGGTGL